MRKQISLILCAITAFSFSACITGQITVPNTEACTAAGVLAAGAVCAHTISADTRDMTDDEYFDFLEPQEEKPDPAKPGATIPGRAGAVCESASDWNAKKTTLEQACRMLGKNCSYDLKQAIRGMEIVNEMLAKAILKANQAREPR